MCRLPVAVFFSIISCLNQVVPTSSFSINSRAFTLIQGQKFKEWPYSYVYAKYPRAVAFAVDRASSSSDTVNDLSNQKNPIYQLLSTPRDNKPGCSNFFYNDEVISHLHGYMFLIGGLAARDEVRMRSTAKVRYSVF